MDAPLQERTQAKRAIMEYIGYYNTERRHSSLGNLTAAQFERRWRAAKEKSAQL
ncbi:MAG: IS3 family transposase [Betaproteobacteria bacterium]